MKTYRDLEVWKKAKDIVKDVYLLVKSFPKDERFGLTDQLKRAAVSIPSNIAEGCGRGSYRDGIRFFFVARGSLYELETQVIIAGELNLLAQHQIASILSNLETCKKLLNGFIAYYEKQAGNAG
jgi:four helix bundle protein